MVRDAVGNFYASCAYNIGRATTNAVVTSLSNQGTSVGQRDGPAFSADVNPSTYGSMVTFTATVEPDTASGLVLFKDGGVMLGAGAVSEGVITVGACVQSLVLTNSEATFQFYGIVGERYHVERTTNLAAPVVRAQLTLGNPLLPGFDGAFEFTGEDLPQASVVFYRLLEYGAQP